MSDTAAEVAVEITESVTITLNGKNVRVPKNQLVIDAAEKHGVYIPRFCYHPRMEPVGMCRMCIVDIDTGRGPALQPSCMIPVAEGMVVSTESPATKKAQDGVLEFLLINHPLDCPVCDKGGECPLQDQAYAYGPGESRFVEEKRHFAKPIPVSDLVFLDRERCILCDRCTRFAETVAGDPLISFMGRGANSEVNTFPDHPFSSYFSGNTVQICPVGALTATPYRFRARPWDLNTVESTCTGCSVGCRITIEASRNRVLRYQGVDVDPVNWGWLCDKGRFGFEAIHDDNRLDGPLVRANDNLVRASWSQALGAAATALQTAISTSGPASIGVVGGARLTNEAAYAWAKLAKGVIGTDNVDAQMGDGLPAAAVLGLPAATIDDLCAPGGTVVLLGPDLKEELPVLYLRLRDAVVNRGVRLIEITTMPTGLTPYAAVTLRCLPGRAAEVVRALGAGRIESEAVIEGSLAQAGELWADAEAPRVVLGRASIAESAATVIDAAGAFLQAQPATTFLPVLRRANVRGALDLGLTPGFLPGRVTLDAGRDWFSAAWPRVPEAVGLDATGILEAAAKGKLDVLVLLGADPLSDFPDRDLAVRALVGARTIIAVDIFLNPSNRKADVVLAASGFAETSGTTTNVEGRVSQLDQKVTPPGTAHHDWILATELAYRLGADLELESIEGIWAEIERLAPAHAGVTGQLLASTAAEDGVLVPLAGATDAAAAGATDANRPAVVGFAPMTEPPAVPPIDAYSLRLVATRKLYDQGTLVQRCSHLGPLAPGATLRLNPKDHEKLALSEGQHVRVTSARGSITTAVVADEAVLEGVAVTQVNQLGLDATELIDSSAPITEVRLERAS